MNSIIIEDVDHAFVHKALACALGNYVIGDRYDIGRRGQAFDADRMPVLWIISMDFQWVDLL